MRFRWEPPPPLRKISGSAHEYWCEKARKHICVTDHHDMTLAVKVALNPNTTNQSSVYFQYVKERAAHVKMIVFPVSVDMDRNKSLTSLVDGCITDHHDMTLAVKVALNPNTTNQSSVYLQYVKERAAHVKIDRVSRRCRHGP